MIIQLHHYDASTDESSFVAQTAEVENMEQFIAWSADVASGHPLPENHQWLAVFEGDRKFVVKAT